MGARAVLGAREVVIACSGAGEAAAAFRLLFLAAIVVERRRNGSNAEDFDLGSSSRPTSACFAALVTLC